jgi:hypothetical protein
MSGNTGRAKERRKVKERGILGREGTEAIKLVGIFASPSGRVDWLLCRSIPQRMQHVELVFREGLITTSVNTDLRRVLRGLLYSAPKET